MFGLLAPNLLLSVLQVSAVSTIVNRGLPLKAYVFRNYNFLPGVRSHYLGSCQHKMWQAIRASSAAPGYFQEYVLGNDLHQVNLALIVNLPLQILMGEQVWDYTGLVMDNIHTDHCPLDALLIIKRH